MRLETKQKNHNKKKTKTLLGCCELQSNFFEKIGATKSF